MKLKFLLYILCFCSIKAQEVNWINVDSIYSIANVSISCYDSNNCIQVRYSNGLMHSYLRKTIDGGENWIDIRFDSLIPNMEQYNSYKVFHFANGLILFKHKNKLIISSNYGINWRIHLFEDSTDFGIFMTDSISGLLIKPSKNRISYYTFTIKDDDFLLQEILYPEKYKWYDPFARYFIYPCTLIIATESDDGYLLLRTDDCGNTWYEYQNYEYVRQIFFIDSANGYQVLNIPAETEYDYYNKIYKTNDGGKTWSLSYDSKNKSGLIHNIKFYDNHNGLVIGSRGIILRTNDAGMSWHQERLNLTEDRERLTVLKEIQWPTENTIFLTGNYGTVYKFQQRPTGICCENDSKLYKLDVISKSEMDIEIVSKDGFLPNTRISVFSLLGVKLYDIHEFVFKSNLIISLKFPHLQSGIYFLKIESGSNAFFVKLPLLF